MTIATIRTPESLIRAACGQHPVDPTTLERLASASRMVALRGSASVWRQGQTPSQFLIVARGMIKVIRHHPAGHDVALGIFGPRDAVGIVAAIDGNPYPAEAIVMSKAAELLQVDLRLLRELIGVDPLLGQALLSCMASRVRHLHEKLAILSSRSVPARLASLLVTLVERYGDELEDGSVYVPVELTRKVMAELIESRIETVIRLLSTWQHEGKIRFGDGGFKLADVAVFRRLMAEA